MCTWVGFGKMVRPQTPAEKWKLSTYVLAYFVNYFSDTIFSRLVHFTNVYALQIDGLELGALPEKIKVFFGILLLMAIIKMPRVQMYWQEGTRIPSIADAVSSKRFFKLWAMLHVTDSNVPTNPTTHKFWKIATIVDAEGRQCLQWTWTSPQQQRWRIDDQVHRKSRRQTVCKKQAEPRRHQGVGIL